MPRKRDPSKTSIYSEVNANNHTRLLNLKQRWSLPLYRIIELCIIYAVWSPGFESFVIGWLNHKNNKPVFPKGGD